MHIMSYTHGDDPLLQETERDMLVHYIEKYSKLFFVKILGFCILDNHFHLLVKTIKHERYTDEQVMERVINFYGKEKFEQKSSQKSVAEYRDWLCSISSYVQMIKKTFSSWYNKYHGKRGSVWGERYKSTLIGDGEGLLTCMCYIDTNPIRKAWVKSPEQYRWSRFGKACLNDFKEDKDLYTYEGTGMKDIIQYSDHLDEYGKQDRSFQGKKGKIKEENRLTERLLEMILSRGLAVGSKEFIASSYEKLKGNKGLTKKGRNPHFIGIKGIYSLRHIKE